MIKKLLLCICLVSSLLSLEKDNIKVQMSKNIHNVLNILKNNNFSKKQKRSQIIKILDTSFDYNIMSMLVLGSKWRMLTKDQKSQFLKEFPLRLKNSYIDKLTLYNGGDIKISKLSKNKNRLILKTLLLNNQENYSINYKFYENKRVKQWYIYDVSILGISIIETYRKQFDEYLKSKTLEDLIKYLKDKNSKR